MTSQALLERTGIEEAALASFCREWRVAEMAFFGSVLRDDFGEGSDVDVLVSFADGAGVRLWDVIDMRDQLKGLFGRGVDLVERAVIERSRNYIRRAAILSSAQVIYAA